MDIAIIDTVDAAANHLDPIPMRYRDQTQGFAKGWYGVALSEEVVAGALKSVTYLDRQLVIYPDANGDARVADAYCPHLGAHLASHDGTITGGELVCPFHKWRFDGATGKCNSIPYTNVVPPQAKLTLYPSMELSGLVLMWYHPDGSAPEYVPFDPASYNFEQPWILKGEEIRTSTAPFRDLFENLFDTAHIQQLHKSMDQPNIESVEQMDYGLRVNYCKPKVEESFGIDFMRFDFSGISLAVHVVEGPGYAMMQVMHATPIDHEHFHFHDRLYVRDTGSEEMNDMIGGAFVSRVLTEVAQDFRVTNTKKHLKQPLICAGDGPIMKYRLFSEGLFV